MAVRLRRNLFVSLIILLILLAMYMVALYRGKLPFNHFQISILVYIWTKKYVKRNACNLMLCNTYVSIKISSQRKIIAISCINFKLARVSSDEMTVYWRLPSLHLLLLFYLKVFQKSQCPTFYFLFLFFCFTESLW